MKLNQRLLSWSLALLTGASAVMAKEVGYFAAFPQSNFKSAGVGGIRTVGYGTIDLGPMPAGATLTAAYLYWHGHGTYSGANPLDVDAVGSVYVNDQLVENVPNIGVSSPDYWNMRPGQMDLGSYSFVFSEYGQAFRADVTKLVQAALAQGMTQFALRDFTPMGPMVQGASLLVFYQDPNDVAGRLDYVVYDGNDCNQDFVSWDSPGWQALIPGFSYNPGDRVVMQLHVSDGQDCYAEWPVYVNDVALDPPYYADGTVNAFKGSAPYPPAYAATPIAELGGTALSFFVGSLWDIKDYTLSDYPGMLQTGLGSLTIQNDFEDEAVSLIVVVLGSKSTPMPPPPANKPPVILGATPPVTADCTPPTGLSVKLEATVADPNGDALTVIWRANGAKVAEQTIPAGAPNAQTTVSLDHLYPAGNNNVTVTVTDNFSPSVTQTIAVTVIPDATAPVVTTVPAGVTVQADANGNAVVPDFRAQVVAADDCPGTLTVTQDPAPGSTVRGTTTVQLRVTDAAGNFTTVMVTLTVTAPAPPPPPPNAIFATFTQGGWGAKPSGNNPGTLLANNFTRVYPSGVTIGGSKTLRFTSASAVEIFLPAGGTASSLKSSAVNPRSGNVLAGQTLALELNARFSAAGITQSGLGSLKVASGKLAGYTVNQVLLLCNAVLGGNVGSLPPGVSISDLNNIATAINENYDNGTTNKGYLVH